MNLRVTWHNYSISLYFCEEVDLILRKGYSCPEPFSAWEEDSLIFLIISNYRMCLIFTRYHPRSSTRQIGEDHGDQIRGVGLSIWRRVPTKRVTGRPLRRVLHCYTSQPPRRAEGIYHPRKIKVILHRARFFLLPPPPSALSALPIALTPTSTAIRRDSLPP